MSTQETAIAYSVAISTAVAGSVGLKKLLERMKLPGTLGKGLIMCTPYIGLVCASSANLCFSRFKDIKEGIPILDPSTNENIEGVKSKKAGLLNFRDSLFIRWLIPIPVFIYPKLMSNMAKRRFGWYKNKVPALAYDASKI